MACQQVLPGAALTRPRSTPSPQRRTGRAWCAASVHKGRRNLTTPDPSYCWDSKAPPRPGAVVQGRRVAIRARKSGKTDRDPGHRPPEPRSSAPQDRGRCSPLTGPVSPCPGRARPRDPQGRARTSPPAGGQGRPDRVGRPHAESNYGRAQLSKATAPGHGRQASWPVFSQPCQGAAVKKSTWQHRASVVPATDGKQGDAADGRLLGAVAGRTPGSASVCAAPILAEQR
jgi:hypothetical protein